MIKSIVTFSLFTFLSFVALAGKIDHSQWDVLLKKHVSTDGKVDYKGFKNDQKSLSAYTDFLRTNFPAANWSENEKLAYWINAYNAFTITLVASNYPVGSIKELEGGKPWDKVFIKLGDQTYNLNDLEHNILRKEFNEPRIHFAINCASVSCPVISNEAFTAENVQPKLEAGAVQFINDPSKNKLTASKAELSSLFSWFQSDFTKAGTVIDFVNKYAEVKVKSTATVSYLEYSWKLNE